MLVLIVAMSGILYMRDQQGAGAVGRPGRAVRLRQRARTHQSRLSADLYRPGNADLHGSAGAAERLHDQRHGHRAHAPSSASSSSRGSERERTDTDDHRRAAAASSPAFPASRPSPPRRPPFRSAPAKCRSNSSSNIPATTTQVAEVLDKIDADAKKSGLFIFTNTDLRFETPQAELIIDKDKANQLGVRMSDVGATLATLLGGNYVNRFTIQGRSYQVIPQVPRTYPRLGRAAARLSGAHHRATWCRCRPSSSSISRCSPTASPPSSSSIRRPSRRVPFPGRTVGEGDRLPAAEGAGVFPAGHDLRLPG